METQRAQAVVVSPTTVAVELDRENFIPKGSGSQAAGEAGAPQTPKETEKPFWVGLVIKGGTVALPPDFIQKDGGGAIKFTLAEGEMIYDLNASIIRPTCTAAGACPPISAMRSAVFQTCGSTTACSTSTPTR